MNITILSGSARAVNLSHRVSLLLQKIVKEKTSSDTVHILDIRDFPLPFIETAWTNKKEIPAQFSALGSLLFEADAIVLVSPEYNGSYSSALKNLLDHFPKFPRIPFGICTYSPGSMAGIRAAQQMQNMVCGFMGIPSPQMLLIGGIQNKIDPQGELTDTAVAKGIHLFIDEFLWLANSLNSNK